MLIRRLLLSLCLLLTLATARANDDAAFGKAFGDDWLAQYWQYNPDYAISVGYYKVAGLLPVPDAAGRKAYLRWLDSQIKRLAGFDVAQLSPAARSDLAMLKTQLESERWSLTTLKSWQWNPSAYNVAEPIAILLSTPYAPEPERLRTVQQRLLKVPAYYAAAKKAVEHPTREYTRIAIEQSAGALDVLGASLEQQVAGSALNAKQRTAFLAALKPARAAVTDYIEWLKALDAKQAADGSARSFRLGDALYEQKFAYDIQSGSTGKALYERALAEKERLHARMAVLADQLWPKYFAEQKPPADRVQKIAQLIAKLSEQHTTREGFVDEVKRQIPLLEAFVREKDLLTQDASRPLQVRETPIYQRGFSIASINAPGPYDPTAKTYYNVSPLDDYTPEQAESFLREYNRWQLQVLNIHEAVPGHYVQLLHANKSPSRIKTLFGNGAMVEGWAVYSEKMMLEAGWGGHEPEMELIHSKWLLRVTTNTLLDYGIHVLNWDEQKVLDLIRNEAFQSETEARGKWRRATLSQVQLTSYFAGYSAIYDYRERLKKELGARFDLKQFHEHFLSYGSAPVAVIESLMKPEDATKP
ncbi:MAG: DUF885 domain-containing protein [Stagnimonas sp.]|nr:DUF885 domain-containing protein [Stagnimonas sp.]